MAGEAATVKISPYTAQMIATVTRQQVGTVERALQIFMKLGVWSRCKTAHCI